MSIFLYIVYKYNVPMSKFKIIKDYQLTTQDKRIIILKAKVFIVDNVYVNKDVRVNLDPVLVENNPEYFQFIDWKTDFINYLKTNKIPQPSVVAKKIFPYIEENFKDGEIIDMIKIDDSALKILEQSNTTLSSELKDVKAEHEKKFKILQDEYNSELAKLKLKNTKLVGEIEDLQATLEKADILLKTKSNGDENIINKYKEEIAKLELELSNANIKKSQYSKDVEEEIISKMTEVNERLEVVIKREGELRASEMDINTALLQTKDIKDRNTLILLDIDSREKALDLKLNDLAAREKHLEAFDREKIIEDALSDFEKGIPWQYWRTEKKK